MIMNSDSNTPYSSNKGDNHSMFSFNKYLIHSKNSKEKNQSQSDFAVNFWVN